MTYDVIIIGGGLGGLVSGAKLAKEGKQILLLEQHDRPGGCATTFTRKDYIMEVGLHEMDGLHPEDGKTKLFDELGVLDRVDFLPVPEFFRFYNGRTDFVMPHDREKAIRLLKEKFPDQSEGIDTYFNRLMNAMRINILERKKPDISIGEYLDSILDDEELKLILLGNLGYFDHNPYGLSLRYYAVAEGAYFNGRANFIKGGSQKLSDTLLDIISENGGKVLLNHKVANIDVVNNEVRKIEFINVQPGEHQYVRAEAKDYILNSSLPGAVDLIGGTYGESLKEQLKDQTIGNSYLTVYFGFSKSVKDLGNKNYSTFVFDESVKTLKDVLPNNHAEFDKRSYTFVDYSQVDSALAPAGKSVGAICCVDYIEEWEGLNREEYKAKKKEVAAIFAERLNTLIPGTKEAIEHIEVGTSKTVQRYTLNPKGSVFGFSQHPNRNPILEIKGIKNLHIASAWGKFGGGFSGAIFSGYRTATDLLRTAK
ncbi:phytoene desaturase family protein [Bacteroidota bacterium]